MSGVNFSKVGEWSQLLKGVPQGSILDPVLFNVFINDIFLFVKDSTIYNYADDNTVSNCDNDIDVVTKTLENDGMELINWFSLNLMKDIEKKTKSQNLSFNLNGNKIVCEDKIVGSHY